MPGAWVEDLETSNAEAMNINQIAFSPYEKANLIWETGASNAIS